MPRYDVSLGYLAPDMSDEDCALIVTVKAPSTETASDRALDVAADFVPWADAHVQTVTETWPEAELTSLAQQATWP